MDIFTRTEILIGSEGLKKLAQSKVAVFGLGGVGSFAAEALARAGIGTLILVDHDTVCPTNINRQLHALHSTLGRPKTELMSERLRDINPVAKVYAYQEFVKSDNVERFLVPGLSYAVDAIDTVSSKLALIERAYILGIPIISAMGAGNRLDPTRLKIGDIGETSICPLARVMRRELKKRGITRGIPVVYSREPAVKPPRQERERINGSISFVPPVCGMYLAAKVVNDILDKVENTLDK